MAATTQISVTNSSTTAVTTQSTCKIVRVTENRGVAGFPTTDFLVRKPASNSTSVRIQAGAQYTFQSGPSFFPTGTVVGYIQTVAGTTTFDQDEDTP